MVQAAVKWLRALLLICALFAPVCASTQQGQQTQPPDDDKYGSRFFEQLRSLFGRFRDSDLQRAFELAKPIQCSDLVSGSGQWRPVAFFNEDRKLGDWCRESLDEVKADLTVYTFKGICGGEQGTVQVKTEFPIQESIDAYNDRRIDFDQVDVNVNDPVEVVFDSRTQAYTFDLPYLFLVGRQGMTNVYSFIAPRRESYYAGDVTSHWDCKAVASSDLTYRFLICRTATIPSRAAARGRSRQPSFGGSAYFILSDGVEAKTSVNLSFGDAARPAGNAPAAAPRDTAALPPVAGSAKAKPPAVWRTPDIGSRFADVSDGQLRLRFNAQTWSGKIGSPQVLSDQRMSDLELSREKRNGDYCVWHPGIVNQAATLLADPPDKDISCSLDVTDKTSQAAASLIFSLTTHTGDRLGTLQCYFPGVEYAVTVPVARWVSVVGGHVTLEVRR